MAAFTQRLSTKRRQVAVHNCHMLFGPPHTRSTWPTSHRRYAQWLQYSMYQAGVWYI